MDFFRKEEWKILWPFYLETFLYGLLLMYVPFYVIYFREIGLSLTQIGLLLSAMSLAGMVFEIPTGGIADVYGRKFSVILGAILAGSTFAMIYFIKNFYFLLILFFVLGAFYTLRSGAYSAWVTDLLKLKKKPFLHDYFIKSSSIFRAGLVISGILGGLLVARFGTSIIWPVGTFGLFFSAAVLMSAEENFRKREYPIKKIFHGTIQASKKAMLFTVRHKVIGSLVLAGFLIAIGTSFQSNILLNSMLKDLGFPVYALGFLMSTVSFLGIIVPFLSKYFLKKIGHEKNFLAVTLAAYLLIFASIIFAFSWQVVVLIMLSTSVLFFLWDPIQQTYFQKFTPSKLRATIGSVESAILSIAGAIAIPIAGWVADSFGIKTSIFLGSVLLIPASVIYYKIDHRYKK